MSEVIIWSGTLLAGVVLGGIFFGGLWWTVQRGAASPSPASWFIASFILRTGIVLAGFYLIGAGQPILLGLCLIGFLVARGIVLVATRSTVKIAPSLQDRSPPCA